jgi:hypothetical protein
MKYQSQERLVKSYSPPATDGQPTGNPPAILGVSSSDLNSIPDLSDPDPSLDLFQRVDIPAETAKKGRGDAAEYPSEFEALWGACRGKKGNKHPAFKAWKKNKPPLTLTIERWLLWMSTAGWHDGYSQHLSTWLNERGWENVPDPVQFKRRVNGKLETIKTAPARPSGPPVAIAEAMGQKAAELAAQCERERLAASERFREEQKRDAGGHHG